MAAQMRTRIDDNLAQQKLWLEDCARRDDYHHWLILISGEPVGMLNVGPWDWRGNIAPWGFYVGEASFLGLGGMIPPYLYNWLFFEVGLGSLTADVLDDNLDVLDLHRFHGYQVDRIASVETHLDRLSLTEGSLVHLRLERDAWRKRPRLHRLRADFPVSNPCPELARRLAMRAQER
nr:hypothetical protein [Thiocystis violacea]